MNRQLGGLGLGRYWRMRFVPVMAAQDDSGLPEMRGERFDIIRASLVRVECQIVGCFLSVD